MKEARHGWGRRHGVHRVRGAFGAGRELSWARLVGDLGGKGELYGPLRRRCSGSGKQEGAGCTSGTGCGGCHGIMCRAVCLSVDGECLLGHRDTWKPGGRREDASFITASLSFKGCTVLKLCHRAAACIFMSAKGVVAGRSSMTGIGCSNGTSLIDQFGPACAARAGLQRAAVCMVHRDQPAYRRTEVRRKCGMESTEGPALTARMSILHMGSCGWPSLAALSQ